MIDKTQIVFQNDFGLEELKLNSLDFFSRLATLFPLMVNSVVSDIHTCLCGYGGTRMACCSVNLFQTYQCTHQYPKQCYAGKCSCSWSSPVCVWGGDVCWLSDQVTVVQTLVFCHVTLQCQWSTLRSVKAWCAMSLQVSDPVEAATSAFHWSSWRAIKRAVVWLSQHCHRDPVCSTWQSGTWLQKKLIHGMILLRRYLQIGRTKGEKKVIFLRSDKRV